MIQPTFYIPHGGGPCFFMEWDPPNIWNNMASFLSGLFKTLPEKPDSIIIVSAHWATQELSVTASPSPSLVYDYYGFPDHTYNLKWKCPGNPFLALKVAELLKTAKIACNLDHERGFDHGVFIPLKLALPLADIPTIQLSLRNNLDPCFHLQVGNVLAHFRTENILLIGSGMSYHDISALMGKTQNPEGKLFDSWLETTIKLPATIRNNALLEWHLSPGAKSSHPTEEHLTPLFFAAGAGQSDMGKRIYRDEILGCPISGFRFG
ncbi:MAG: dioxygenase [Magnetovibrio sp.]|nr:dioxygenase [Magnetovibrio sp.]